MKNLLLILFVIASASAWGQAAKTDTCSLTVPNALTITAEHTQWKITCEFPIKDFHIEIYNRWGVKTYESDKLQYANYVSSGYIPWEYWNCKEGSYYWIMKFSTEYKGAIIKKQTSGSVTLIKKN